jgi:LCP family protein required for cell wall assembly
MQEQSRARFPSIGAVLSFLFPGLGQLYSGQPAIAAVLATPVVLVAAAALAAYLFVPDSVRVALFNSQFLTTLLALDLALLMWRLFAIAHVGLARPLDASAETAGTAPARTTLSSASGPGAAALAPIARRPAGGTYLHRRGWEIAVVAVLLAITVVMHAWAGIVLSRLDRTLHEVFAGGAPVASGGSNQPLNQPSYHWDGKQRINFLLLGIDSDPSRSEALTDTILVVSVDPVHHTAVMVSIPRDTGFVPLPDRRIFANGLYPDKINSLTTVASQNPKVWCPDLSDATACGIRTLQRTVGLYLGIQINYYATVNLRGFADLIDALGGVPLCLDGRLTDSTYTGPTWRPKVGITLEAGCQVYDGAHALAYARIRKGTLTLPNGKVQEQNDFTRAERQQDLLVALGDKIASSNWVISLPGILNAVSETVSTDFPRSDAGNLTSLIPLVLQRNISRVVLGYPGFVDLPANPLVNYLLVPKRAAIRAEAKKLFGASLKGWYVGSTDQLPPVRAP